MTKEKIQLIVTAAGIIILIFLIAGSLKKKPAKGQTSKTKPVQETVPKTGVAAPDRASPTTPAVNDEELSLQKERAKLDWGKDPFTAVQIGKEFRGVNLELKGISFGKDKRGFAFINNEIVKEGDIIGDCEVIKIEKDKALLRKSGQTFYLTLPQE